VTETLPQRRRIGLRLAGSGIFLLAVMLGLAGSITVAHTAALHPLDPLSVGELAVVGSVLSKSGQFSTNTDFAWTQLQEPPKQVVEDFKPGAEFPRQAYVAAIDFDKRKAFAVIVDVKAKRIADVTELKDLQPGLDDQDTERAQRILDADETVKAALIKRGLNVPGKVSDSVGIQYAPIGHDPTLDQESGRLVRAFFASDQHAVSDFSPFVDGLMAVVDLYAGRVIRLRDAPGVPNVPVPHDIFDPKVRGATLHAHPIRPMRKVRRNFAVAGNVVAWQNWQFRFGFNLREGLVLYQVAFNDHGKRRSILYRASVAEVVTAYGDASDFWSWLELFDEGVFGLGGSANAVSPGREVPANALTLNPVVPEPTKTGFATRLDHRIYVYERDAGGLLYYQQGNMTFHAHATELVIGFVASLGNYEYGFNWVFKQDGSFAFETELAGLILTKFVGEQACGVCQALAGGPGPDGESRTYRSTGDDRYGTLVHPNLVGANHQHWFNLRLDFDIDGRNNAVLESNLEQANAQPQQGDAQAGDRYFGSSHTVFGKAVEAKRDMNEETARTWTIYNPSSLNRVGRPAGYTVVPMENAATVFPPARESEAVGFTFHPFWVTPYRDGQFYPGGAYPNQAKHDYADTLYHYANQEPIYDKDIVVWYSMGMTHFPRPEDYPIMSNAKLSVLFRPNGFFERNAAVGLGQVHGK
jgi:primary-amine oxidase